MHHHQQNDLYCPQHSGLHGHPANRSLYLHFKLTVRNRADPCHICDVTKQSPHPYYLKIRPCNAHVDRHRWEILDNEGLLQTSADSFATEREAKDNGRLEMQGLVEIWNKK